MHYILWNENNMSNRSSNKGKLLRRVVSSLCMGGYRGPREKLGIISFQARNKARHMVIHIR